MKSTGGLESPVVVNVSTRGSLVGDHAFQPMETNYGFLFNMSGGVNTE